MARTTTNRSRSTACSPGGRDRQRAQLCDLHDRSRRAVFRRQAGDARRRAFFLAAPARQGPPEPPHLLHQGGEGEGGRPNAVRFDLAGTTTANCRSSSASCRCCRSTRSIRRRSRKPSFEPPIGSGPYVSRRGRCRAEHHARSQSELLGTRLPINRGFWNFDEIRFDYFRDANAHLRGLQERPVRRRARRPTRALAAGYDFPAVRDGRIVKETIASDLPKPGFYSSSIRGARSLTMCASAKRSLCCSISNGPTRDLLRALPAHRRATSTDPNCPRIGRPADARERALLAPFPDVVRADILDGTWRRR